MALPRTDSRIRDARGTRWRLAQPGAGGATQCADATREGPQLRALPAYSHLALLAGPTATVLLTQDELLKALEKAQDVEYVAPARPFTPNS